ncbi:hypothetical protein DPV78_010959 [Talaromyces pinophilus]|nr:hypothetical protein DPV78_010959 [Talaromyces pinophilus]
MYELPPPPVQDDTFMVGAQGIQSSVNDLLKYATALQAARRGDETPLKNTPKQFAGHIFRGNPLIDKSYGLGLMRTMLPGTICGGSNAMYTVLPTITPGPSCDARLVAFHGGSQAGYTSFLTMLPEADISIVVLTNSIGLGDPASYNSQPRRQQMQLPVSRKCRRAWKNLGTLIQILLIRLMSLWDVIKTLSTILC